MPFFQLSLFDKSRGVTYTSGTFGTYKEAHGAYQEFIESEFMTDFFDISLSKITEKTSYTSTPKEFSERPLEGMYYDHSDTKNVFVLHIMDSAQRDMVEQVMTTYGVPVDYEFPGAFFQIPYLHTIQRLGATDIVTANPDEFADISVVGTNSNHIHFDHRDDDSVNGEDADGDYVPDEVSGDEDEDTDENLEGFCYEKYGKGYLLTCSSDHDSYGDSYFLEGWWNDNAQGWFFKAEYKSLLKERGAIRIKRGSGHGSGSARKRLDFSDASGSGVDETLEGMVFFTYGRGFIMKAPMTDTRIGTKYFHGGWWNAKQNGWFFKHGSETVQRLTDLGAKHLTSKKSRNSSSR
jgi:hypothetical protein